MIDKISIELEFRTILWNKDFLIKKNYFSFCFVHGIGSQLTASFTLILYEINHLLKMVPSL